MMDEEQKALWICGFEPEGVDLYGVEKSKMPGRLLYMLRRDKKEELMVDLRFG